MIRKINLHFKLLSACLVVLCSSHSFAHNKVVVIPLDSAVSTESCGAGINVPCTEGVGVCERAGVTMCTLDFTGVQCSATPVDPGIEVCNGLDDDCDMQVDEDFNLGSSCFVGEGICRRTGFTACTIDSTGVACDAVPGNPVVEICGNFLDDDCNGLVDESCPPP